MQLSVRLLLFASSLGLALSAAAQGELAPGAIEALPAPLASHPNAIAQGLSASGDRVVGVAAQEDLFALDTPPAGLLPFVWSAGAGYRMVQLPDSLVDIGTEVAIAGDGETVVGHLIYEASGESLQIQMNERAFRWTAADGLSWLPVPGVYETHTVEGYEAKAIATSAEGYPALGSLWLDARDTQTVLWDANGSRLTVEPPGAFGTISARDVSADGSVVVGAAYRERISFARTAFRWTASGGSEVLAPVADVYERSEATAVSADGSTTVGYAYDGPTSNLINKDAFRVRGDELVLLGSWFPRDVSADGSVVVGAGLGSAVVWTENDGMIYLDELLDVGDWRLDRAVAVSADGTIVVGTGVTPDGRETSWRARLPARDDG